jgi:hypothetical protein
MKVPEWDQECRHTITPVMGLRKCLSFDPVFAGEVIARPAAKPWGMYEFALNRPDDTLVRVGWPSRYAVQR